jgi:hypothetical protein
MASKDQKINTQNSDLVALQKTVAALEQALPLLKLRILDRKARIVQLKCNGRGRLLALRTKLREKEIALSEKNSKIEEFQQVLADWCESLSTELMGKIPLLTH